MRPKLLAGAALVASTALHAGLLLHRSDGAGRARPRPPSHISFSLASPPSPKALAPAPPPLPPPPAPKPRASPEPKRAPASTTPPREPEVAAEVAPAAELTGTTLVSDLSVGWSAPAGNGEARDAVVRGDNGSTPSRSSAAPAASVGALPRDPGPPVAPLRELSRKPSPPSLTASLARNYPVAARNMGKSGEASVRALVEASGKIQRAHVTAESSSGFGEACRRSLIGSLWGVPLDRAGRPVATWITYRCKFRVDD